MIPLPTPDTIGWAASAGAAGLLAGWAVARAVLKRKTDRQLDAEKRALSAAQNEILRLSRLQADAAARLERLQSVEGELEKREQQVVDLSSRCVRLETLIQQDRREARDREQWLEKAHHRLREAYQALSATALKENNAAFMDLAQSVLGRFMDQSRSDLDLKEQAIVQTMQPLKESLDRYEQQIQAMERTRESAYGGITQQVKSLVRTQEQLQREAGRLATALRSPQVRGRWGELTLRRVAELSGMQPHCDFVEQPVSRDGERRSRPDLVIHLPGGRLIVVDAKVPLNAYLDALEANSEERRERCLRQHADRVLAHIQQLSRKAYWSQFQPTPEFVVLFIPGENFLAAALSQNPALIEEGAQKDIILASPTTLISLLKAVSFGWRQEKTTENARRICELGQELYDRLLTLTGHFQSLGRELGRAVESYNRTVGSFERRVLTSARRFEDLGLSPKKKPMPAVVDTLTILPANPQAVESHENND
ncbi:MAG: DNA recombination protein RmuC [Desulfobacterales bacterium]